MKSRNHTVSGRRAREQRQQDAQVRQESRALSTAEEQIAILDLRPGASARERARLAKQVGA
jgi:hypothetical protein